jgi:hypothetical protein
MKKYMLSPITMHKKCRNIFSFFWRKKVVLKILTKLETVLADYMNVGKSEVKFNILMRYFKLKKVNRQKNLAKVR